MNILFSQVKNITITERADSDFGKDMERMLVISKIYNIRICIFKNTLIL